MSRLLLLSAVGLWAGTTLVLGRVRWFSRVPLIERLRPYAPNPSAVRRSGGLLSVESFADVVGPLCRSLGQTVAKAFGVNEDLATRLQRVHSPLDVTAFRVRQVGWATGAFGLGVAAAFALGFSPLVGLLVAVGAPLLAFLVVEQQLATASADWQRRVFLELPVVSEQLAMLLSAGYSLGAALQRLAGRGHGACGRDLNAVVSRMQQGVPAVTALREWSQVANVPALDRLVAVLALEGETSDLGRLISDEARSIRADAQRRLIEIMDKRAQQVWVPVTVATLIPGVIFLAIPFIEALRLFSGS
ncbi:MAG: type II secretion system F family protein [Actinobacteria bacterium]|nr:type II secretion system F family protein [Actinomycetota bacterium]